MPILKIKELTNSVKWQFAKTMPEIPHEYIVVDPEHSRRIADNYPKWAKEIDAFIEQINKNTPYCQIGI